MKVNIEEVRDVNLQAQVIANGIAESLEKRVAFRRLMKQTLEQVMNAGARGVKVAIGGRLNGADARVIGLRGPLIVAGWGYGIDGTSPANLMGTSYLRDSSQHKAGPVDLLWDNRRKVWTANTLIPAKTANTFSAKGVTNKVKLYGSDQVITNVQYDAMMFHNGSLASGVDVLCQYSPVYNKLIIISADC